MTEAPYHRIAAHFFNTPLLLAPTAANTISAFLMSRMRSGPASAGHGRSADNDAGSSTQFFAGQRKEDGSVELHSPRASRFYGDYPVDPRTGRPMPYRRTADGTGIITIVGETVNRGAYIGASSGVVSYEGIKYQIAAAAADDAVKNIVLDIESPGGEAVGAFEVAAAVRQAASVKPVTAVVNGMAASAGYAIASGATRIVTMPTGLSGSIGVVMLHYDFSKYLEDAGVKPTFIFAGAHKVDGNIFEPLPADVRARMQADVTSFYNQFVETVAAGRRGMSAKDIRGTEAQIYKGQDAVDVGLADAVGTFEEVLAELSSANSRASQSKTRKGNVMNSQEVETGAAAQVAHATTQPAQEQAKADTVAELALAYPALVAQIRTEAATAERTRILGIETIAVAGHDELIASCKADPGCSPEKAAMQILHAEKGTRGKQLAAIKGVEREASKVPAAVTSAAIEAPARPAAAATTPEGMTAEFNAQTPEGEKLRAEFPDAATYVAFKQAEGKGLVRRLVNRTK